MLTTEGSRTLYRSSVWLGSDVSHRTRSLKDAKTFTVFAELSKPSQSVMTVISSVRTDHVCFEFVVNLLQETIAGDVVSRSFRPGLPGNEYPTPNTKPSAPSQESDEYGRLTDRGDSQVMSNPDDIHGPRFSSPIPNEPQMKKHLAGSGRSNSRGMKIGTSFEEWKPERLSNGNYRYASSLSLCLDPYPVQV